MALSHTILSQFLMISISILIRFPTPWCGSCLNSTDRHGSVQFSPSAVASGYAQTLSLLENNRSPSSFLFPFSGMPAKEKINLTLVKMVRKTLFRTFVIGVKAITIGERDGVPLQIQPRQLGIYSQQVE